MVEPYWTTTVVVSLFGLTVAATVAELPVAVVSVAVPTDGAAGGGVVTPPPPPPDGGAGGAVETWTPAPKSLPWFGPTVTL